MSSKLRFLRCRRAHLFEDLQLLVFLAGQTAQVRFELALLGESTCLPFVVGDRALGELAHARIGVLR